MKANPILLLTLLTMGNVPYAADETVGTKPKSGSAATEQESPSHPATGSTSTKDEKAGAGVTIDQTTAHPAASKKSTSNQAPSGSRGNTVRNWTAIDTNRDNSISPEEMQMFLEKGWADMKKSS
jgi:hypothetical protein